MKYCRKCGGQIEDDAVICVHCGCSTEEKPAQTQPSTLKTVAKVFMILSCVVGAFCFFIPLLWTLPMTIKYCNAIKNNESVSTGFKVCTLLFVSMIAGILMLCDNDNK